MNEQQTDDAEQEVPPMDTEHHPDPPGDDFPVFVSVGFKNKTFRFTTSSDFITATDVPAHVMGGLEGWRRRGDHRGTADYRASEYMPDPDDIPVLTVPVHDLRRLRNLFRNMTDDPERHEAYNTINDLLDDE